MTQGSATGPGRWERIPGLAVAAAAAVAAVLAVAWWFARPPSQALVMQVPGLDDPTGKRQKQAAMAKQSGIGEFFETFDGKAADLPGAWPGFRGANSANISREVVKLVEQWPQGGPEALWSVDLGEGHAAPAVWKGRVYVLDYIEEQSRDALRCFSLADGKEIWRRSYKAEMKPNHGRSRTIPAVTDECAVTLGPKGHVMCVDSVSGNLRWGIDMVAAFGTKIPGWYTGQCPLIDGDAVILAPCGTNVLMFAADCKTGKMVWKTPTPGNWQMSHSSIMPMTLAGKKMYVYAAVGGMAGVSAEGADRGLILWQTKEWRSSVIAPSPVVLEDGRIFVTAGYGAGSMMFKVTADGGKFECRQLYKLRPRDGLACEQQTPILLDGLLYGIQPKDAGALQRQFVCFDPDNKIVWTSGQTVRFGIGPFLFADGKFLIMDDEGVLTMIKASRTEYAQLAQAKVLNDNDTWGPMALAGGRLLVRGPKKMVCLDMTGKLKGAPAAAAKAEGASK